jgi:hypothetical protein
VRGEKVRTKAGSRETDGPDLGQQQLWRWQAGWECGADFGHHNVTHCKIFDADSRCPHASSNSFASANFLSLRTHISG